MVNKKTVGMITMHKVINYGSALQAYALQKVIADMGYGCEIIDYIFPNNYHLSEQELQARKITWKSYVKKYMPVKSAWRNIQIKHYKIKRFWGKHFKLSSMTYSTPGELQSSTPVYDIYVTGSDQVWNPRFMKGDPSFFLSFTPEGAQKVAFSPSFACAEIPDSHVPAYKKLLSEYTHISVREQNGAQIVKNLLDRNVPVTLDPTLLLTPVEWKRLCPAPKKKSPRQQYILAYVLNYAFNVVPYIYDLIKHVQKELGYEVIFLGVVPKELKHVAKSAIGVGPIEFLDFFENASFVVSSSFHGTSFAANYNIPFYTVVDGNTGNDDRQLSLMRTLGIESRAVPVGTDFSALKQDEWDAEEVQCNLAIQRDSSLLYLGEALRGAVV